MSEKRFKYGKININSLKKEICGYKDDCQMYRTTEKDCMCMCAFCLHAAKLDVPKIINELLKKKGYEI